MSADLFNPVGAQNSNVRSNSDIYKVSYKDGKQGIYSSVIRFIPNAADTSKCVVEKQVTWVKNPVTKQGMYIDDPRSVNQFSPTTDMFFNLYNTKRDDYIKLAKEHLSSKTQYASLVQIVRDEQHPELQGQIKVFIYGKTIHDMLYFEEHPEPNPMTGVTPQGHNPFHPIYGRYFNIKCKEKSGFNNFDDSCFLSVDAGATSGIYMPNPATNTMYPIGEDVDRQQLLQYLMGASPDLTKYEYHPWTPEQTKFVEETLQAISNFITTGSFGSMPAQAMPAQTAQPMFPGATTSQPASQPMMQPASQPMMQTPVHQTPNNMGGFSIQNTGQQNVPAQGGFGAPVQGSGSITGMPIPELGGIPSMPSSGSIGGNINVDEIIGSL